MVEEGDVRAASWQRQRNLDLVGERSPESGIFRFFFQNASITYHSCGGRRGGSSTSGAPERAQWTMALYNGQWRGEAEERGESHHFPANIFVATGGPPGSFVVGFGDWRMVKK